MSKRVLIFIVGLFLAVLIGYTSTLPTQYKHALHTQGTLHPWLHFFGFGVLTYLLVKATRSQVLRIVLFAALLFFGWATEKRESGKDHWPIEWKDVHTDEIGVTLGFVLALVPHRQQRNLPARELNGDA